MNKIRGQKPTQATVISSFCRAAKNAAMGFAMNCLMAQRSPTKFMLLKTICGIQLWRSGTTNSVTITSVSREIFFNRGIYWFHYMRQLRHFQMISALNHLAICCSPSTVRRAVDRLCAEHDVAIKQAKQDMEVTKLFRNVSTYSHTVLCDVLLKYTLNYAVAYMLQERILNSKTSKTKRKLFDDNTATTSVNQSAEWETIHYETTMGDVAFEEEIEAEPDSSDDEECSRLSIDLSVLSVDEAQTTELNVPAASDTDLPAMPDITDVKCQSTFSLANGYSIVWDNVQMNTTPSRESLDKQAHVLLAAMSFAAVNRVPFVDEADVPTTLPSRMPLQTFLPNEDDYVVLKRTMVAECTRILLEHLSCFAGSKHMTDEHKYSHESGQKSTIINLGVDIEDPGTTAGGIKILRKKHQFVPMTHGVPYPIICYGDGGSVNVMKSAKRALSNEMTPTDRLEGLIPQPQDFHKRGILLQDYMNSFFTGKEPN